MVMSKGSSHFATVTDDHVFYLFLATDDSSTDESDEDYGNTYTPLELGQLMQKAENYISSTLPGYTRITQAYRNSSEDYFNEIMNRGGLMRVCTTDYTGDQRNPVNGQIKGL